MFKLLLKKHLMEIGSFFVKDRKTGKKQSPGKIILFVSLWLLVAFSLFMAGMGISSLFGKTFFMIGLDWFYFIMMGLVTMFMGLIGSVFLTFSMLYKAKDNDLLLSMPINTNTILAVKVFITFLLSLVFSAIFYAPTLIYYYAKADQTASSVICSLLMFFVLGLISSALCCVLGYLIALISNRLRNKTFVTVFISLLFFFGYYYVYFRINKYLSYIVANGEIFAQNIKGKAKLVYWFGHAFTGDVGCLLGCAAAATLLFALVYFVLSRNYLKLMTTNRGEKKTEYVAEKSVKTSSMNAALFSKEMRHFTKSVAYMLNPGLGAILMVIGAAFVMIKADTISGFITSKTLVAMLPDVTSVVPLLPLAAVFLMASMVTITAPSISLEGRNIWILKSMPIEPRAVFESKKRLQYAVGLPGTFLLTAALCYAFKLDITTSAFACLTAVAYMLFITSFGLMLNLLMPNLEWKDETVPIKQSLPVMIIMFGGWAVVAGLGALYWFLLKEHIAAETYIKLLMWFFIIATAVTNIWIDKKGVKHWNEL
ncbi:MAG: hypothetical protein II742_01795 [Clostridia bacterium]|nr:hypothetical protein [Clostridia bacterium]